MKRLAVSTVVAVAATLMVGTAPAAEAVTCPPASVGGTTVATITVGTRTVPVKNVTFRDGGALLPPATNKAAGISLRNEPLHSRNGATVITWHVRFGPGCPGTLNDLTTLPIGSTFTVGKVGKAPRTYEIAKRVTVPKGVLKRAWFSHTGRHRVVLITCNDLQAGSFVRTMAIIARPVPVDTTATATPATVSLPEGRLPSPYA